MRSKDGNGFFRGILVADRSLRSVGIGFWVGHTSSSRSFTASSVDIGIPAAVAIAALVLSVVFSISCTATAGRIDHSFLQIAAVLSVRVEVTSVHAAHCAAVAVFQRASGTGFDGVAAVTSVDIFVFVAIVVIERSRVSQVVCEVANAACLTHSTLPHLRSKVIELAERSVVLVDITLRTMRSVVVCIRHGGPLCYLCFDHNDDQ
mmetsp:Transcript_490/g.1002  ORF Transcript_490/g.1002 Transcript_490/m.1002 type:complete len:205 (+) Transcript_490:1052-1666(+)